MRKVALDLGSRQISLCEVKDGKVLSRRSVRQVSELESVLGPGADAAVVAIEACREAWHVHDVLTAWGNDVVLVDTTRSRRLGIGQHGRKTDRIDAEVLALALERGGIPSAHVLSPHRRQLRRELGIRRALVETRAQYIVTIRGLARESGQKLPTCASDAFVARLRETELDAELKTGLEPLLLAIDTIDLQIAKVEERLAALCAQEPVVTLLATLPGVNTIIAATFVSVIDEAGRFRDAHQVESYLGLVPRETTSGGANKRRLGSITLKGNSYCRAMLVQAGWQVLRRKSTEGPLQAWAHAVSKRRGRKVATVATARRLAGILWAMWRDGTAYDPRLLNLHGARGLRISAQDLKDRAERLEQAAKKMTRRLNDSRRRTSRLTAEVTHPS